MAKYHDYPLEEIGDACMEHIKNGATIYQKFTCEKCEKRLMMDVPNILFTSGGCDHCGHVTDIRQTGCNYLLISKGFDEELLKKMEGEGDD